MTNKELQAILKQYSDDMPIAISDGIPPNYRLKPHIEATGLAVRITPLDDFMDVEIKSIKEIGNEIIDHYYDKKNDKAFEDTNWFDWFCGQIDEQVGYHNLNDEDTKALYNYIWTGKGR